MSNVSIFSTPRRRGAQPGNRNALRHGYYARNLGLESPTALDEAQMRNLLGEAGMLKDFMFQLYNKNIASTDSAEIAETLRALSMASMALARLLDVHSRIRIFTPGDSSSSDQKLHEIIDSLNSFSNSLDE
jgi:hypothetical protein